MSKKQISFFATRADVNRVVEAWKVNDVHFVRAGMFAGPQVETVLVLDPLESYLAVPSAAAVKVRAIPQRSGGVLYGVDQVENPQGVSIQTGGQVLDCQLVAGQIGASDSEVSDRLYRLLVTTVRKHFDKIKSYYVGAEAVKLLDAGGRLSPTAKSPKQYDLSR